jgi:hypothetical protein
MARRVPVMVEGSPVGTIIAPIDSGGPHWETVDIAGVKGTVERRYRQVISIMVRSLADAQRLQGFQLRLQARTTALNRSSLSTGAER